MKYEFIKALRELARVAADQDVRVKRMQIDLDKNNFLKVYTEVTSQLYPYMVDTINHDKTVFVNDLRIIVDGFEVTIHNTGEGT